MSASRASEYQWHAMLLHQKRKKARRPFIVIVVVWGFMFLFMYILHRNDSAFIQATQPEKVNLADINYRWVDAHPYAQVENACFSGVELSQGLISDKKRYFLMEPCDPWDTTPVRVVVVTETHASPDVDEEGSASAHFRTGQISTGLEGREMQKWSMRDAWELDDSHRIYTLKMDHTPQSVCKNDALLMTIFTIAGILTTVFGLLYRKKTVAAREAWLQVFRDKFPDMNIK